MRKVEKIAIAAGVLAFFPISGYAQNKLSEEAQNPNHARQSWAYGVENNSNQHVVESDLIGLAGGGAVSLAVLGIGRALRRLEEEQQQPSDSSRPPLQKTS